MTMNLVPETHELLKSPLEPFEFSGEINAVEVANELVEFMLKNGGIGLSANQVGLPYRMFVMRTAPEYTVCINPRLVDASTDMVLLEEGCLSYPGLHVKIKRPAHIKVRFQKANGETVTEKYTGLTARVFLHELDHMEGVNFLDRAGKLSKDVALRKWRKLKRIIELKRKLGYGR